MLVETIGLGLTMWLCEHATREILLGRHQPMASSFTPRRFLTRETVAVRSTLGGFVAPLLQLGMHGPSEHAQH